MTISGVVVLCMLTAGWFTDRLLTSIVICIFYGLGTYLLFYAVDRWCGGEGVPDETEDAALSIEISEPESSPLSIPIDLSNSSVVEVKRVKRKCQTCGAGIHDAAPVCSQCGTIQTHQEDLDTAPAKFLTREVPLWAIAIPSAVLFFAVILWSVREKSPTSVDTHTSSHRQTTVTSDTQALPESSTAEQQSDNARGNGSSPGRVKGTVTYFDAVNKVGGATDVGSNVYLLSGDWSDYLGNVSRATPLSAESLYQIVERNAISRTIVDGNGNYEIGDIPEGTYTLFIKSRNGKFARYENQLDSEVMGSKCCVKKVSVYPGKTIDVSFDFGMFSVY